MTTDPPAQSPEKKPIDLTLIEMFNAVYGDDRISVAQHRRYQELAKLDIGHWRVRDFVEVYNLYQMLHNPATKIAGPFGDIFDSLFVRNGGTGIGAGVQR